MKGRCPRCGEAPLFAGLLKLAPSCTHCGLDFVRFDTGDGPAVFAIIIVGAIIAGAAIWTEMTFAPPPWIHAVLWIPLTMLLSVGGLRVLKAGLVYFEFKHDARPATPD